jgi:hypothetical protein
MITEQITLRELVSDPIYRQWFKTPPLGGFSKFAKFRVYVQKDQDGGWAKKDFEDFKPAYNFLARNYKTWHDSSLTCRNEECRPPVVRKNGKREYYHRLLVFPGHTWCTYCRRPTVFSCFTTHHAFSAKNMKPIPYKLRCGICGIAEEAIKRYRRGSL